MKKGLYWLILLLFFTRFGHSESEDDPNESIENSSLAAINAPLATTVNNCISIISGELIESQTDLVLAGPEPLVLERSYTASDSFGLRGFAYQPVNKRVSFSAEKPHLYWHFNHLATAEILLKEEGARHYLVRAQIPYEGSHKFSYRFKDSVNSVLKEKCPLTLYNVKGVSNYGNQLCGGQTNPKNAAVSLKFNYPETIQVQPKKRATLTVTLGSGEVHSYSGLPWNRTDEQQKGPYTMLWSFRREAIYKPNGNQILYDRVSKRITATDSSKSIPYSWMEIDVSSDEKTIVKTSLNSELVYKYHKLLFKTDDGRKFEKYYLASVESPYRPTEKYFYTPQVKNLNYLICRKEFPNNRFLNITYYQLGDSEVGEYDKSPIQARKDPRRGRVKELWAPVGTDATPILTHRFYYDFNFKIVTHRDFSKASEGITTVYDAYNRKTVYQYNKDHRLIAVHRCGTQEKPVVTEKYIWGYKTLREPHPYLPPHTTDLLGKYIYDEHEVLQGACLYEYDERGNVTSEKVYGNLSGSSPPLILDDLGRVIQGECYTRTFTYSEDGFNLLLSQGETNGKKIVYQYRPQSNLLTAEFTFDRETLHRRTFYDYDQTSTIVKKIEDDGCTLDPNNLSGVHERHVTYFYPRQSAPFGLYERIDEMYTDPTTGQENLLKSKRCTHSIEGRLLKEEVYDATGAFCYGRSWEYNGHGLVTKETDPLGYETVREYDDNDNLTREFDPSGDFYTDYTYDFSNRLIHKAQTILNPKLKDTQGLVEAYKYDYVGNRLSTIDRSENATLFTYDDFNRLIKTIKPAIMDEKGLILNPTTSTEYDSFGNPVTLIDAKGRKTFQTFNARGKPLRIEHPDGTVESFIYNLDGTLLKAMTPSGTYTVYEYDSLKRCLKETCFNSKNEELYSVQKVYQGSRLILTQDAEGCITRHAYDGAGRLIATAQEDSLTTYEYDPLGRLNRKKEWIDPAEGLYKALCYQYDNRDQVLEERIEDQHQKVLSKVSYRYDGRGNKVAVTQYTQAGPATTHTAYNSDNQPIQIKDPLGHSTLIRYNYKFINPLGQLALQVQTCDPSGVSTLTLYDALGRVQETQRLDPLGHVIGKQVYGYDAVGNKCIALEGVYEGTEFKHFIENIWSYTVHNQVEKCYQAFRTPDQKVTAYHYNALGQLDTIIKPNGVRIKHVYDPLGRLKRIASSDKTIAYAYHYNNNHEITKVVNLLDGTTTERTYDRGRLIQEKLGNGLTLIASYDPLSRVTNIAFPDLGITNQYAYDALHLKEARRLQNDQVLYTHSYQAYDLKGLLLKSRLANGTSLSYTYDRLGRLKDSKHSHTSQTGITYSPAGDMLSYSKKDPLGAISYTFAYDDHRSLISEKGHENHEYHCDSLQNRIFQDGETYEHNHLNQIISHPASKLKYDTSGNLISKTTKAKTIEYTYDAFDRLIKVVEGKHVTRYTYDPFHRRLTKQVNGVLYRFLYIGQNEVGSVDKHGKLLEYRLLGQGFGAEIGASLSIELQNKVYTPLHDYSGHIIALMEGEQVVETYRYTTFGVEQIYDKEHNLIKDSLVGNPWRFASKRKDKETGLVYFGRRYYVPEWGRWLTTDPAGFIDGSNLYAYLHHNPLVAFDAYGLEGQAYIDSCRAARKSPYFDIANSDFDRMGKERINEHTTQFYPHLGNPSCYRMQGGIYMTHYDPNGEEIDFANGALLYVNGMNNSFDEAEATAKRLSEFYGKAVLWVYNQTQGPLRDTGRCIDELKAFKHKESFFNLARLLTAVHKKMPNSVKSLLICHSEGAIITRNTLMETDRNIAERFGVLAIAPGGYIRRNTCFKVYHYLSERDFVPLLDTWGWARERQTITVLKPHDDAPLFDHTIESPTYSEILKHHINLFNQQIFK